MYEFMSLSRSTNLSASDHRLLQSASIPSMDLAPAAIQDPGLRDKTGYNFKCTLAENRQPISPLNGWSKHILDSIFQSSNDGTSK